ncbi:Agrin [Atta colombica]|uniref:Agrin n=1 Tax=Atta colombica TaxID=520822 RepID=A0A195AU52_9HYME|nr:Agrin [Atta colombica]
MEKYNAEESRLPVLSGHRKGNYRTGGAFEPCEKIYCAWGATCIVSENGKGLCQCSTDCPLTSDPVCGSDDVTYTNHCHLRQASCQNRKNIRMKHKGACAHTLTRTAPINCAKDATNSEELKTVRDKRPKMAQRDSPLKLFRKDTALAFVRRFIPHSSHSTARRPGISQESYKPADYNDGTIREEHSEKKVAGQPTGNRY